MEIFISFTLPCINTMVANHFEMFFWYMLHKQFDKFNGYVDSTLKDVQMCAARR